MNMIEAPVLSIDALLQRLDELERENHGLGERLNAQLESHRSSEERLRRLTDNLPVLIAYVDAEHRYRFNNKAYESWLGCSPEAIRGAHMKDVLGWMRYEAIKPFVQAALAGQRTGYETWVELPDGKRYIRTEYIPDRASDDRIDGFHVMITDITEFWHSQTALAQSEARLRLALDAGRMAIWEMEAATDTITLPPELNRLLGFPPEASATEGIRSRYYSGERERLHATAMEALARGERHIESELQVEGPDGSPHWLLLRAELQDIRNGQPTRTLGVALDITHRKKAEEHQRLLINELNHRVKNTLASVQSIAAQSLRNAETTEGARSAIEGRLLALSRAHDVLTREHWDGAYLHELVQEAIAPFQSNGQERFAITGPDDVRLPPRVALSVAMALQELGTNAVKYGALSNEKGRIAIAWTVTEMDEGAKLEMVWRETGGPPVSEPSRRGFGTRLIERSLAQELHGSVGIAFAPSGVICSIRATLLDARHTAPAASV
jgi:PAS domain S-box-containing protein